MDGYRQGLPGPGLVGGRKQGEQELGRVSRGRAAKYHGIRDATHVISVDSGGSPEKSVTQSQSEHPMIYMTDPGSTQAHSLPAQ
jgi:hypothetical protein